MINRIKMYLLYELITPKCALEAGCYVSTKSGNSQLSIITWTWDTGDGPEQAQKAQINDLGSDLIGPAPSALLPFPQPHPWPQEDSLGPRNEEGKSTISQHQPGVDSHTGSKNTASFKDKWKY